MIYETHDMPQHSPALMTWLLWTLLTSAGGILSESILLFDSNSNATPLLNNLLVWTLLALPLFFVSLGQWLVLRRLVVWSGWWLLTSLLGFLFLFPYLFFYGFSDEYSNGQSLVFGTQAFWSASLTLALLSLVFGGMVGLVQGLLVIRRYGRKPARLLWWIISSALAWGIGYPLGGQFLGSILPSSSFISLVGVEGTIWGIIGAVTGATLVWLGRKPSVEGRV